MALDGVYTPAVKTLPTAVVPEIAPIAVIGTTGPDGLSAIAAADAVI